MITNTLPTTELEMKTCGAYGVIKCAAYGVIETVMYM